MIKDPMVPREWVEPMQEHLDQIANMAASVVRENLHHDRGQEITQWMEGYICDKRSARGCMLYRHMMQRTHKTWTLPSHTARSHSTISLKWNWEGDSDLRSHMESYPTG